MVTEAIAAAVNRGPRGTKMALARATGVTPQTVSKWIKHEISPDPERWPLIEEALEMAPGTLRDASGMDDVTGAVGSRFDQIEDRLSRVEALVQQLRDEARGSR